MASDLSRLLRPRSIAVVGGGAWCAQVVKQSLLMGFSGDIHIVHPKGVVVEGIASVPSIEALPEVPDAVFVGVNRHVAIEVVAHLARIGVGGAVCFASGFAEAVAEDTDAKDLQAQLVAAAADMPLLGPNCYGYINALDGALLWPDTHGCARVESGVAILTQSSNIAINLTMQLRGLPIAYVVACGNMAQTTQADIALGLLDDPRVTAIGLHIEGFGDTGAWHRLAVCAAERGVPLIALKVGASEQAQRATVSHTASLAGNDAGASALLARLGIGRVRDLPTFIETLKLLHVAGPLDAPTLSSVSCSGGEASLAADTALGRAVTFPALTQLQTTALRAALGSMVALSNPLDYNTYIWRDAAAMARAWAPMAADHIGLTLLIVDYPHTDATDWECATLAALAVRAQTGRPVAMVATLPELMPLDVARRLMAGGVVPMNGLTEAVAAAEVAAQLGQPIGVVPLPPGAARGGVTLSEVEAKAALAGYGVIVPKSVTIQGKTVPDLTGLAPPFAVKGTGLAHKTEANAVRLNVALDQVAGTLADLPGAGGIVEEMVVDGVAELLVGVIRDPAHGFVLTLGAGGVLTEIVADTVSLLVPSDVLAVKQALTRLKSAPLLTGYRGRPTAEIDSIVDAVMAVQAYVIAHADVISEVEINPLICTPTRAVAADALIRIAKD